MRSTGYLRKSGVTGGYQPPLQGGYAHPGACEKPGLRAAISRPYSCACVHRTALLFPTAPLFPWFPPWLITGRVREPMYCTGSVASLFNRRLSPVKGGRILSAPTTTAARSRPGRQVSDPYQAQKLLACSNQRDITYSPFTLTYYLRPRRWAMPGGLGNQRIGTGSVASLSAAQFSPPLVSSMYQVGRVRAPMYWYRVGSGIKKSLADWRDFSVCVGITYLPGKSPCKYCRRR